MSCCELMVPGARLVEDGDNGEILELSNIHAATRIALKGAKVLSFVPVGGAEIIGGGSSPDVLSHRGIPVCWPWFGGADTPAHGFVRGEEWRLDLLESTADGGHRAVFGIDPADCADPRGAEFNCALSLTVEVGRTLEVSLSMRNLMDRTLRIGCALHTYFHVSDIANVELTGLDGVEYVDCTAAGGRRRCTQRGGLRFDGEVDWVFDRSRDTVELIDSGFKRVVRIEKSGSASSVVWNPGEKLAERIADLSGDAYRRMVCVESANAFGDVRCIDRDFTHTLTQKISWKSI